MRKETGELLQKKAGGACVSIRGLVFKQDFLGAQEGQFLPSSDQSASSESLHREIPFKDRGTTGGEGTITKGRLAMHDGLKGRLPVSSSGSGAQEVPSVCVGSEDSPIYPSSFRFFQYSKGIHRAPSASDGTIASSKPPISDLTG